MRRIHLYTDGACSGNPGDGGWAFLYTNSEHPDSKPFVYTGYVPNTTNNRMELTAVIKGLTALMTVKGITVHTDSRYVCDAVNKGWLDSWAKNSWRKSDGKPVKNKDLWMEFLSIPGLDWRDIKFEWIEGHTGDKYNELCDKYAVKSYKMHCDSYDTMAMR